MTDQHISFSCCMIMKSEKKKGSIMPLSWPYVVYKNHYDSNLKIKAFSIDK